MIHFDELDVADGLVVVVVVVVVDNAIFAAERSLV